MPLLSIRPVTHGDTEQILTLWRQVFPEYDDPARPQRDPRSSIARKLALGDGLFWLAEQGGAVMGTVMAGWDGHRGWIYSLGVDPGARRAGIGRALLEVAEARLAALGCPKVNLQVLAGNEAALAFWRRAGYAPDPVVSLGKLLG